TLASKGTSQRTEKACLEPEDLEEDTLDTVVDGQTMREIISTLPFTLQFNRNLKPKDWKDMDKFFFSSTNSSKNCFNGAWTTRGSTWHLTGKICLKEIDFKDLMVITKDLNPTRHFRLLEARAQRIRENKATIQAIEEQLTQTGPTQIPSGSQGADQISSPVASHHSDTKKSITRSHHSSQFQEVSRRRKRFKGKNKTSFSQRQRESDPMIQKLLDLVKEVHKNHK
ncbi:hypothetical protein O181_114353, partial [Austropuccinia psidii MF-1]|nr:hypothetical protein [Austropuccinia psidii MF-1]